VAAWLITVASELTLQCVTAGEKPPLVPTWAEQGFAQFRCKINGIFWSAHPSLTFETTGHIIPPMARHNVREQIVEAGLKTLLEKGFNGVGVQEITATAGVPKGSFYNHFESKEALGAEIVERYGAMGDARRAILGDKSIPPLDRLRTYFSASIERVVGSRFEHGCLLGNFSAELSNQSPLIRGSLAGLFSRWTKDLQVAIADAQAEGAISTKVAAADLAAFLLDAYEGALLRARVERDRRPFDRFMELAFTQILT
jgi:TetR/AcrR family transcriptional repressor of nem operon